MGIIEQVEMFLGQVERNIDDFGDRFARGRIDLMLSTMDLLGIRERLPKGQADSILADLKDVEELGDIPSR